MATMYVSNGPFKRWFAWRPVRLRSGELVWLERIERQRVFCTVLSAGWSHTMYEYQRPSMPASSEDSLGNIR